MRIFDGTTAQPPVAATNGWAPFRVKLAFQREPVKRRVVLKIIKLGMDSRQIVARFEAERQALAMMDHANIAKILDTDVTDTGGLTSSWSW